MATTIVFETHALSEDNERGVASGWAHSRLSARGRRLAEELAERRRHDGITAVFSSDLRRAVETTAIAFPFADPPVLLDWRLRECDYGDRNGTSADTHVRDRVAYLDQPYPGGESWRGAIARVARWLDDLTLRWSGARVLVVGHVATRWALDHYLDHVPLETLAATDFAWQAGWQYQVSV
jgi:2,3-bisphosphoglycerate-dependent phosphoglycerate mutase